MSVVDQVVDAHLAKRSTARAVDLDIEEFLRRSSFVSRILNKFSDLLYDAGDLRARVAVEELHALSIDTDGVGWVGFLSFRHHQNASSIDSIDVDLLESMGIVKPVSLSQFQNADDDWMFPRPPSPPINDDATQIEDDLLSPTVTPSNVDDSSPSPSPSSPPPAPARPQAELLAESTELLVDTFNAVTNGSSASAHAALTERVRDGLDGLRHLPGAHSADFVDETGRCFYYQDTSDAPRSARHADLAAWLRRMCIRACGDALEDVGEAGVDDPVVEKDVVDLVDLLVETHHLLLTSEAVGAHVTSATGDVPSTRGAFLLLLTLMGHVGYKNESPMAVYDAAELYGRLREVLPSIGVAAATDEGGVLARLGSLVQMFVNDSSRVGVFKATVGHACRATIFVLMQRCLTGFDGRGGPVTTFPSHNQYRTRP